MCPNAGFFTLGLAMLQGIVPLEQYEAFSPAIRELSLATL
jgi:hypothetical protein